MKKFITAVTLLAGVSGHSQNPAEKAIHVTQVIEGTINEAVAAAKGVGMAVYKPGKQVYGTLWHDWAACFFEDGFVLYNRFQAKRFDNGGKEVSDYFHHRGDGHSFYIDANNCGRHVCLTQGPSALVQKHGPIVSILAIDRPPTSWNESCQDGKAMCP